MEAINVDIVRRARGRPCCRTNVREHKAHSPRPHLLHGHLNRYSDPLNASSADTQAAFADQIADEFGQPLTKKYQVQVSGLNRSEVDFDDIDRLGKYYPDGDIILDVKTLDWSIAFQMPAGYWLSYHARLRLIDRASQKILAQEHCSRPRESLGGATSFDEIRENEAAALKRALRDAVRAYTAYFRAQL